MMKDNDFMFKEKELDKGEITNSDFITQPSEVQDNTKRDLARLVDYLRMRVESFKKDRVANMSRIDSLKIKNEEMHKTEGTKKTY